MSNLISALAWVTRGVAAQHPKKYVLDNNELERISSLAHIELEDARVELERAQKASQAMEKKGEDEPEEDNTEGNDESDWVDADDGEDAMQVDGQVSSRKNKTKYPRDLSQYNLDDYDQEADPTGGIFSNIKGLTYYRNNDEDPYITLKDDEEDNERDELEILPADNLIIVAKTEDEVSQLEIYVFEESEENLYVHHDLMLPNFPLCLEWLDFPPVATSHSPQSNSSFGNYIAVGTLDPEIEIWSLDVLDAMYPATVLGRPDVTKAHIPTAAGAGKKKRKKVRHRAAEKGYHVDAVLGLSWNRLQRNFLASASADRTVKLWDLSRSPLSNDRKGESDETGAIRSFDVHKDKVQALQWNAAEPSVLLTGSYDRTVRTFDTRAPNSGVGATLGSDVEALRWDPFENYGFYVSLENGLVLNFDARTLPADLTQPSPARFTLAAHDGATSALDVSPHIRGCIVTGGADKFVKVWNITDEEESGTGKRNISLVTSRDLGVGKVFSTAFSPDDPLTIAAAGSKAKLQLWDVGANYGVRKALGSKLAQVGRILKERATGEGGGIIGVTEDVEDSEQGDDDNDDE